MKAGEIRLAQLDPTVGSEIQKTRRCGKVAALVVLLVAQGCAPTKPDEPRPHDARRYTVDEASLRATLSSGDAGLLKGNGAFAPIDGLAPDRWVGVLQCHVRGLGAAYNLPVSNSTRTTTTTTPSTPLGA